MRPLRSAATVCGRNPPALRTVTRKPAPRSAAAYMYARVSFSSNSWKPTTIRGPARRRAGSPPSPLASMNSPPTASGRRPSMTCWLSPRSSSVESSREAAFSGRRSAGP